jgi:hypothetical protein
MWWREPLLRGFTPLVPTRMLEVMVSAHTIAASGSLAQGSVESGRQFERKFYQLCESLGIHLCEQAGSATMAGSRSASGYRHELDATHLANEAICIWELKHLQSTVPKNELLIFHAKSEDYLMGLDAFHARIPIFRILMSTRPASPECRRYAALFGILLLDATLMPLPLLYEALVRGFIELDQVLMREYAHLLTLACRPLQGVLGGIAGALGIGHACYPMDTTTVCRLQDRLSPIIYERLQCAYPDWETHLLGRIWRETGGWRTAPKTQTSSLTINHARLQRMEPFPLRSRIED